MSAEPRYPPAARRPLLPDAAQIGRLRVWVGAELAGTALDADQIADASLVVSELMANAIEAAPSDHADVLVEFHGEGVEVRVVNRQCGPPLPAPDQWSTPLPDQESGRGLQIVASLSDQVTVTNDGQWTVVSCLFHYRS